MAEYVMPVSLFMLGLLIPACAGWLWGKVKTELNEGNDGLMKEIKEIKSEQQMQGGRLSALETEQQAQGRAISFLQGADSARTQTTGQAVEALRGLLGTPAPEG